MRTGGILPLGLAYCYEGLLVTFRRYCNRSNPTKIAVLFVSARANAELVHKFHFALCTPNIPIKFLPSVALPVLSKFCHNLSSPVRRQIRPGSQLPSIAACSGSPLPSIAACSGSPLPSIAAVAYRGGGVWGVQPPPPKFLRYRWSSRSHKQEEPASRFPFAVHCVLIRL